MKNTNNVSIKKIVILLIVILIPLLASTFIGIYGYNRYQGNYFDVYMDNIEDNTKKKALGFLQYTSESFEEEPFISKDVKREDKDVLTLEIYRSIGDVTTVDSTTGESTTERKLQYNIAVYNINYSQLIAIKDPTGEERLQYNKIPALYVKVTDNANQETEVFTLSVPNDNIFIYDYNASPEKDYKGNLLSSKLLKWLSFSPSKDYSNDLTFELLMSDKPNDESNAAYYAVITEFDIDNFEQDLDKIDSKDFTEGYKSDIKEAGYLAFIFKDKLWWQILIALVAVGLITFSFYLVWTAEEAQVEKQVAKRRK